MHTYIHTGCIHCYFSSRRALCVGVSCRSLPDSGATSFSCGASAQLTPLSNQSTLHYKSCGEALPSLSVGKLWQGWKCVLVVECVAVCQLHWHVVLQLCVELLVSSCHLLLAEKWVSSFEWFINFFPLFKAAFMVCWCFVCLFSSFSLIDNKRKTGNLIIIFLNPVILLLVLIP